ncbi:hypothetical protein QCA50_020000 [Cerrena zonata]|uniref:Uncharacterized protein n=1 Tax=Cerrena zonata TaxID=2478898 RepID=A0AAW0FK59_9APHY
MLVNDTVINKLLLSDWLECLTDYDWSEMSISMLLNLSDSQDVPHAVQLICIIIELCHLNNSTFSPQEQSTFAALCLLGDIFEALMLPYITPTMTLSQQITSLISFSHLVCALFLENSISFMSNQLYGDLQAMTKNAIFHVAKTQVLNPKLEVFFALFGDDMLKTLFGRIRMIGSHTPNCNIQVLGHRLSSARNLQNIFYHHPEWEKKPQRLQITRSRDVDHLSPHS